jgi:hypothetical protein
VHSWSIDQPRSPRKDSNAQPWMLPSSVCVRCSVYLRDVGNIGRCRWRSGANHSGVGAARIVRGCSSLKGEVMNRVIALVVTLAGALFVSFHANAQPPAQPTPMVSPEPPLPLGELTREPAPPWLAWRAFHGSLQFYGRQSPERIVELLDQRARLSKAEVDAVLEAGQIYLDRIQVIDDSTRAQLRARFRPTALSPGIPTSGARPSRFPNTPPPLFPVGIPARLPDGRKLSDVLESEGFIQRLDAQREQALRAHLQTLERALGSEKVNAVQALIASDVAPKVHVVTRASPPATAPSVRVPAEIQNALRGN